MKKPASSSLSRRERQIMDLLYQSGRATAAEIQEALPSPPSYSATRAMLRILEEKGHVRHEEDGPRYVYTPRVSRDLAKKSALHHIVQTFFEGSAAKLVSTLVSEDAGRMTAEELSLLANLIEKARQEGK
ncbi:MAG: BlaI/MecI/CopY family transcriptional regulator [Bryobacteraceae bacterium]